MSTQPSVDPILLERTKQQIRGLVNEIARLAKQDVGQNEFYGEFLGRVVSALAGMGGAIWSTGESGGLELAFQINLRDTKLADNQDDLAQHSRLIHKVLTSGEATLVPPNSGTAIEKQEAGNPTEYLLVLGPIKIDQEVHGVVEIFQRPGAAPTTQRGYLRFLEQMCDLAADYVKSRQLRHFTDRQTLWNQLENFARLVHSSLDSREAAYTIANEGRRLIQCDRVSVAIRRGRKCYVEAVSGQDTFDKRSNTIYLLNRLATAVVRTGDPMWYTGDTTDLAPQVEEAVQEYVDDSHSKTVAVLPLKRPIVTREDEEEDHEKEEPAEPVGVLIVEQIDDSRPREGMLQRVDVVCDHSSTALANALDHDTLFLMPVWRALGKSRWVVSARTLPKTVTIAVAVVAVGVALAVIPADFDLQGKGTLQPVERRDVFASQEGTVDQVFVEHETPVKAGEPLLKLRSNDLEVAITGVEGDIKIARENLNRVNTLLRGSRGLTDVERVRLEGESVTYLQEIKKGSDQLALLLEKRDQLTIHSPIEGQVTTWEVEDPLMNRPVHPGNKLMSVADLSKEWELEVQMPEDRMGYIAQAQNEMGDDLTVTFILATDPGTEHEGRIREVHLAAEVRGEEGNTVLIRVEIDKNDLPYLRPGAGVTAKVHCGRRSIGYTWFHDLVAFVQSRVLFRLW